MEEKTLLRISLLVALIGLLLLYFFSLELELNTVSNLEDVKKGDKVKVKGVLGKFVEKEKVAFLEVWNEKIEKVNVVLFKDEEKLNLKEGDYVEIEGTVEEYQGQKEVIGNKIVKK